MTERPTYEELAYVLRRITSECIRDGAGPVPEVITAEVPADVLHEADEMVRRLNDAQR